MIKTARTLWAGFCLMCGVIFAALFLPVFLLTVGVFVGVPAAIKSGERSTYWQRAWVGFDRWCNVMLGGVITETISSRLGKTKLYGCKPVFWYRWADLLVGWWLHQIDHNHVEKSVNLAAGCNCLTKHFSGDSGKGN